MYNIPRGRALTHCVYVYEATIENMEVLNENHRPSRRQNSRQRLVYITSAKMDTWVRMMLTKKRSSELLRY